MKQDLNENYLERFKRFDDKITGCFKLVVDKIADYVVSLKQMIKDKLDQQLKDIHIYVDKLGEISKFYNNWNVQEVFKNILVKCNDNPNPIEIARVIRGYHNKKAGFDLEEFPTKLFNHAIKEKKQLDLNKFAPYLDINEQILVESTRVFLQDHIAELVTYHPPEKKLRLLVKGAINDSIQI